MVAGTAGLAVVGMAGTSTCTSLARQEGNSGRQACIVRRLRARNALGSGMIFPGTTRKKQQVCGPPPPPLLMGQLLWRPNSRRARRAAVCGLLPGLQTPSATDDDLSRPVEKRQQRHENMTDAEVTLMVKPVVLPIAQSVPFPEADGGLAHGAFSAGESKKRTPAERAAHTAEALRSVQLHFGDSAPYLPLGRPENRARKDKPGSDKWKPPEMAKAAIHFHVIGTVVVVQPEVRICLLYTSPSPRD